MALSENLFFCDLIESGGQFVNSSFTDSYTLFDGCICMSEFVKRNFFLTGNWNSSIIDEQLVK
ncbi:9613_t:CDS:2 [Funneliformis caledonium]|uniref:9613_t:CDS:1 n=1 Tax=Funneliformis caledonium TaxID=1117310 RepID=A0A9N9GA33_9GLOM|nr:9613_t:CDS:2 [Funneliformis caledonium]